jgi:hypothetical protein
VDEATGADGDDVDEATGADGDDVDEATGADGDETVADDVAGVDVAGFKAAVEVGEGSEVEAETASADAREPTEACGSASDDTFRAFDGCKLSSEDAATSFF